MANVDALLEYQWSAQPKAQAWLRETADVVLTNLPYAARFADRLYRETGNRFYDLVDTVLLGNDPAAVDLALQAGWTRGADSAGWEIYENHQGIFPRIAVDRSQSATRVAIELKVEFVADFLAANDLTRPIVGEPWAHYRSATIEQNDRATFSVAERHGWGGFRADASPDVRDVLSVFDSFRSRPRDMDDDHAAFAETERLVDAAIGKIGRDYACDRFFAAEREYWTKRNRAAIAQKARQDKLGIGWANHDHHTYRSSRLFFAPLVRVWEKLGLVCRERFYAGKDAGWGAQVMEHPITKIITFNDVDLSPEELLGDFSHDGLQPRDKLGTVGLWCGLHGEAFLQAGMHHLECMFDFDALKEQLEREHGIRTMKPFTDFTYLRQAFTEGERWSVSERRITRLLEQNLITAEQAQTFRTGGAIGSHMENLERNDGFKGFNQHGVSEIIAATDPRKQAERDAFEKVQYQTVGTR